jgi:hypothetical protein
MKKILSFILAGLLLLGAGTGIVSAASGAGEGFNNAPHHSWNWKEMKDRCLTFMSAYWHSDDESVRTEKEFDTMPGHHSRMNENHDKHHSHYNHLDGSHHRHHGKMHHGTGWGGNKNLSRAGNSD